MLANENVTATSGGDEDLAERRRLFHGHDLEARHGRLQCVDRVDLGDENTSTHAVQRSDAALADVTIPSDDSDFAGNHDVRGTLDAVDERLAAAVKIVEFALRDRVVDVNGRAKKTLLALLLEHAVKVVHTGGRLFGDAVAVLELFGILCVHQCGEVAPVVENKVELLAVLEGVELLLEAPLVFLLGLALPREAMHPSACDSDSWIIVIYIHWGT